MFNNLIKKLWHWAIQFSFDRRFFQSLMFFLDINRLNGRIGRKKNKNCKRIFILLDSDNRFKWFELANTDKNIQIFYIPKIILLLNWQLYLDNYVTDALLGEKSLEKYYHPEFTFNKKRFENFCYFLISKMVKKFQVDGIIFPKLNDDWITDCIKASLQTGLPIIVDDRETFISHKRLQVYPPILKRVLDFKVNRLCVANEVVRDFFYRSGYAVDEIKVLGNLTSDFWFRKDLWQKRGEIHPALSEDKIQILYFSFGSKTYMNFFYGDEQRDWTDLNRDYHEVLLHILTKYRDTVQIVYKFGGKPQRDYFSGYDDFYSRIVENGLEKNIITLNVKCSTFDLINTSDIILGFLTTGIVEAMFTDKPIVVGGWHSLYDDIKDTLVDFNKTKAVIHADSKEQMVQSLEEILDNKLFHVNKVVLAARKIFREKWNYRPDGNVGKRYLHEVISMLGTGNGPVDSSK